MFHNEESHTCACGGNCGCQDSQQLDSRYLTRDEYIARLEQYLADLKAEIEAVELELNKMRQPA